jgi:hypothetical protein
MSRGWYTCGLLGELLGRWYSVPSTSGPPAVDDGLDVVAGERLVRLGARV